MKETSRIEAEQVAGNGLLHRRMFLAGGVAAMGAGAAVNQARAAPLTVEPWMKIPGTGFNGYGQPSKYEEKVARTWASAPGTTGTGSSRTPHHLLNGMITPSGLHYERSHSGIPDINPDTHRLLIHGLVKRPLVFTLDDLGRYPMHSQIAFVECAGNSGALFAKEPTAANVQAIHGLLSCSEWTGVKLSVLLQEAGIEPAAKWVLAEGADAAGMSRSFPVEKALDDALICLYQNGERVRPANGYPVRLLLPGFEGNMNVKWLRRIKLTEGPTMTKDETSKYTILLPSGKALQFVFPLEGKSIITHPSPGLTVRGAGLYEISGLAWSGYGKITKVEVSADGGKSWGVAALQEPVLSKAATRFRMAWQWDGGPAVLQSRSTDETGYVQPSRSQLIALRGDRGIYHNNMIQSWAVAGNGEVKNVYA
ncbi:MAG TPA: sulfite dehydrogenase [Xanthobacteraceae bacterium]|nr:sulfite dehydrogenase [Xanthobacteraceae bacterium]